MFDLEVATKRHPLINTDNAMSKKTITAELAVISSLKGVLTTSHYDPITKCLYLDWYDCEDVAVLQTSMFSKIFDKPKYQYKRQLPIVKISYKTKSIYRRMELSAANGFVADIIALTPKSISDLTNTVVSGNEMKGDRPQKGTNITITSGCSFMYYWHHPNSATRMSFQIGVPSLIIGVISLLASICSLLP